VFLPLEIEEGNGAKSLTMMVPSQQNEIMARDPIKLLYIWLVVGCKACLP
jgi:hypothetical protein